MNYLSIYQYDHVCSDCWEAAALIDTSSCWLLTIVWDNPGKMLGQSNYAQYQRYVNVTFRTLSYICMTLTRVTLLGLFPFDDLSQVHLNK